MPGSIPPLANTSSWRGTRLSIGTTSPVYLYLYGSQRLIQALGMQVDVILLELQVLGNATCQRQLCQQILPLDNGDTAAQTEG